jgi:hypothetical protein
LKSPKTTRNCTPRKFRTGAQPGTHTARTR